MDIDIVTNSLSFINKLFVSTDTRTIQFTLQNCILLTNEIITLEHIIDKLHYSVNAEMYKDSLKFANECKQRFYIFKNDSELFYIKGLNERYHDILNLIKKKLLDKFEITKNDSTNNQINQIVDLLEILKVPDRDMFLNELAEKICTTIPDDLFHNNYVNILNSIFPLIEDKKYTLLKKWNIDKYIINVWSKTISDRIMKEDIKKLDIKMLKSVKLLEDKLNKIINSDNIILSSSFDQFCNDRLNIILSRFNIPNITNSIEDDVLKSSTIFIFNLKKYDEAIQVFLNRRNKNIIIDFYSTNSSIFLNQYLEFIKNNFDDPLKYEHISILNKTTEYIKNNLNELNIKYPETKIDDKILEFNKKYEQMLYSKYKEKITSSIDYSLNKYQENIFKTLTKNTENLIGNILNVNQDKNNFYNDEVSEEIINMCKLLTKFEENENIIQYFVTEINKIYKEKIIIDNLMKYNRLMIRGILIDVIYIKNTLKKYSVILNETENRIKFLNSDVYNNKLFVEQFKIFYKDHNKEYLKKIIKFKNLDQNISNQILKIYENNY